MTDAWDGRPPGDAAKHTGPHFIKDRALDHVACVVWCHVMEQWHDMAQTMEPRGAAKFWRYLGPALLPADLAARDAETREKALREAAEVVRETEAHIPTLKARDYPDDMARLLDDIEAAILALIPPQQEDRTDA